MFHHSNKETNAKCNKTRLLTESNNHEDIGHVMHKQMSLQKTSLKKANRKKMGKYCH